jgi:glutamate-1-semialdehyde 2,1-aminomutase
MTDWVLDDQDREIFRRELDAFVPDHIFDAHAHLYRLADFGEPPAWLAAGPPVAGLDAYRALMDQIHPGRRCEGLFFGFPNNTMDTAAANRFTADEAARSGGSRTHMLVTPDMDPEFVRDQVRRNGFAGLKCYHLYAPDKPTWEARVSAYLPEEQVRVADRESLSITLHMVRSRAMADAANQADIRHYCERYPNIRMILAHAARGFNPHHTIEGIGSLRGLGNVWCDTSAVTDCGAIEAIARTLGVERLLYGSDFPVSHLRTRCVALGDSFLWLTPDNTRMDARHGEVRMALCGIEALRTLKVAAVGLGWGDREVEMVFRGNAAAVVGERA